MFSARRRNYLCVIFPVVGLLALASCNSTTSQAQSAPTAKTITATGFVASVAPVACVGMYSNATNTYHIACPKGWTATTATVVPNGVALISPTNTAGLLISTSEGAMETSQFTPFLQKYLDKVGATKVNVTQKDQQVTAGATTWTEKKATFSKNDTDYTVAQYATVHNNKTYFVEAVAPTANFDAAQATFQSELASFEFN